VPVPVPVRRAQLSGDEKKRIKLDAETVDALEEQMRLFREKFGRDPGPEDPVFFDPDADVPTPLDVDKVETEIILAARKAGFDEGQIKRLCAQFGFDYDKYRSDA